MDHNYNCSFSEIKARKENSIEKILKCNRVYCFDFLVRDKLHCESLETDF